MSSPCKRSRDAVIFSPERFKQELDAEEAAEEAAAQASKKTKTAKSADFVDLTEIEDEPEEMAPTELATAELAPSVLASVPQNLKFIEGLDGPWGRCQDTGMAGQM